MFVLGALVGSLVGAAGYTAHFAHATSYLSDDPRACVNCHIMNDQYASWSSSSHHARATCNDCHVPHDSILSKYYVKAEHGYRHSKGFTLQDFHEPIQIKTSSRNVVIANCVRCHATMTHEIRSAAGHAEASRASAAPGESAGLFSGGGGVWGDQETSGGLDCIHCHSAVAHGPRR